MEIKKMSLFVGYSLIADFFLDSRAETAPYVLLSATGLDPSEITNMFYGVGSVSGSELYNFVLPPREVVLTLALNPRPELGETTASLRQNLYKMIGPTRTGAVQFRCEDANGGLVAFLWGVVKRLDTSQTDGKRIAQVTLLCDYPLFRNLEVDINTVGMSKTAPVITDLESSAPHGLKLHVKFTGSISSFQIDAGTDAPFRVNYDFAVNDILYISSNAWDKYVHVWDASLGAYVYLSSTLTEGSIWPLIFPGINTYSINTSAYTFEKLSHYPSFWGGRSDGLVVGIDDLHLECFVLEHSKYPFDRSHLSRCDSCEKTILLVGIWSCEVTRGSWGSCGVPWRSSRRPP